MKPFSIRLRLTAWYFVVLIAALGLFGIMALLAMQRGIEDTVDEGLREQADGIEELIKRVLPEGQSKKLGIVRWLLLFSCIGFPWAAESADRSAVKIEVYNGSALIPASINGKHLQFLIDTGSSGSAISETLIEDLMLQEGDTTEAVGNYGTQSLRTVQIGSIKVADSEFHNQRFAALNLAGLSRALGVSVGGVLGNDILKNVTFQLIYSSQTARFGRTSELGDLGTPVKLKEVQNQFFVPTNLVSVNRDLLLDTGANATNLSSEVWEELSKVWTPKSVIDGIASSANSPAAAFLVCLPHLRVGNIEMKDQAVRVQRAVSAGAFSDAGFSGILGSDLLRQFEVTYDLGDSLLFLKPDPGFRPDPYKFVTIGIQFAKDVSGVFTVVSVWKKSPAAQTGIFPGDRIVSINGENAAEMSLEQFSARIHGKEGTRLKVKIKRENQLLEVTVKTQKLLC